MRGARLFGVVGSLVSALVCLSLAWADFRMGVEAYRHGDDMTALHEFWSLAQQGHSGAEFNLGVLYARGRAVPQDVAQAARWYERAARRGHALAQCNLGALFEQGEGVVQSDSDAVHWYRLSAEQGNDGGQNNLARMYEHGRGVTEDVGTALFWYRRAADQGNVQAQASLGRLYFEGKGVRQDDVAAHLWSSLSASRGSRTGASLRDAVGRRMSTTQLRQAEQLFRDWAATK
jgi:uncharacterized protein